MIQDILFVLAGLVLLYFGGEGLVKGSVAIATRLGLSTFLVGVVIVGFGTSAPELLVSVQAAFRGTPDIALGNVVGSNIANILLILGVSAILVSVSCKDIDIRRDALVGVLAATLLAGLSFYGRLSLPVGVLMVGFLAGYLVYAYRADRKKNVAQIAQDALHREHMQQDMTAGDGLPRGVMFVIGGLLLLLGGANLLVEGAVSLARAAGVSEAVIGLTLVAVGTSLPELATAIVAAMKKHADVVIGNVLGSNLFNILFILGTTAIVAPIPFTGRIAAMDVWVMLGVVTLLYLIVRFAGHIGRPAGMAFLAAYAAYTAWLFVT